MSRSSFSIATTSPNVRRMPRRRTAAWAAVGVWHSSLDSFSLRGACVAKRLLQNREPPLQLLVRRRERRQESDHVPVEAAREEDEALLARRGRHSLRRLAARLGELEREHRAEPPHLADDRLARRDRGQPVVQERRDL